MAQSLGFRLHDCAWPPPMMFAVQTPHGEERRCQKCGFTTDENKPFEPLLRPSSGWMA
jgi:hypothetical protein